MPRFFFDFRQADRRTADFDGLEFDNVEQAYLEVFQAAQEMWSELLKQRRDPRRCSFEVRGEKGDVLFVFPFQEVMDCCTDRLSIPLPRTVTEIGNTHDFAQRIRRELAQEVQTARESLRMSRDLLRQP